MKPEIRVAIAMVRRAERWLVARRRGDTHLRGMWEFPGGKMEVGETAAAAALRELREECGLDATFDRLLPAMRHEYDDRIVQLTPVLCRWTAGEAVAIGSEECRWVTLVELQALAMPEANAGLIAILATPDGA